MKNPYRLLKEIVRRNRLSPEEVVHAVLASVYTECCSECNEKLHSEEFIKAVNHMMEEIKICKELSKKTAA